MRLNRLFCFQIIFCLALSSDYYITRSSAKKGGGGGTGGSRGGGGGGPAGTGGNFGGGGGGTGNVGGGNRVGSQPSFGGAAAPVAGKKPSSFSGKGLGTGLAVGAVGGLAAGVLGATVAHQIAQGSSGGYHDGRYYYYGDRNYPGPAAGMVKCTLKVSNDFHANYSDGAAITELVYECNRATDTCCSNGCCPLTNSGSNGVNSSPVQYKRPSLWSILVPLAVLVISVAIVCFCVYKCIRRRRDEAAATQTVHYESGAQVPTMMQGPDNKQWAQQVPPHQQPQPYYGPGPGGYQQQPPPYSFPQQPPPQGYNNYGFQPPHQQQQYGPQ